MAREATLAALRASIQQLAPTQGNALAITPVSSGISNLDQSFALGGLPAGRVSEIAGLPSSGKTGLGLRLLAEQTRLGKWVAVVDGTKQFYPPAAAAIGIDLCRMLLIAPGAKRAHTRSDDKAAALARAAEIIARSRAFSMVLIDLPPHCKMQRTPARRLCAAAQATGTTIVALSSYSGDVEGCAARIEVSPCQVLGTKSSGIRARRTQVCIAKGGHIKGERGHAQSIEFTCKPHRFDANPPRAVAPILHRAACGEEA